MLTRWIRKTTKTLDKNPWWTYKLDEFQIPGKLTGKYHYVHTNGSSMIIPITEQGKIVLVNQFRYLYDRESIEFPCGSVKTRHDHLQTAHIELREETGFRAGKIKELALFNPYNGVTDEICKVFLATQLQPGDPSPDDTEELELLQCTPQQLDEMIQNNTVWDGMTLAAWALTKQKVLQELTP